MRKITISIPDDLYNQLDEQAKADDRSIANYIIHLLKQNKTLPPVYYPANITPSPSPSSPVTITTIPSPENPTRIS